MEFTCCSASSILPPRAPCKNGGVRSVRDNVTPDRTVKRQNRERRSILPASSGGGEPGWNDMVNRCELPINVVTGNRQKRLRCLTQHGRWSGSGAANSPDADDAPPAERQHLRHSRGTCVEHGKPVSLPGDRMVFFQGTQSVRRADGDAGMGVWKTRRAFGNRTHRGFNVTPRESGQTSTWSSLIRRT